MPRPKSTDDTVEITTRVPRSALQVVERAETISQRTSERVTGVPASNYLDALKAYQADGGEVLRLGKLRLVRVEPFVAWLAARSRAVVATPAATPDPADDYASELGLRATGGARR
jgi:hypothetical protein